MVHLLSPLSESEGEPQTKRERERHGGERAELRKRGGAEGTTRRITRIRGVRRIGESGGEEED